MNASVLVLDSMKAADLSPASKAAIEAKLEEPGYAAIPPYIRQALRLYLFGRVSPSHALRCLLEGEDAVRTVLNFGESDVQWLRTICLFLHWEVPSCVHGSKQKVGDWLRREAPNVRGIPQET